MKEKVIAKLSSGNIQHSIIGDDCIALLNSAKIDTVLEINKDVIVQDYNSQQVGDFLKLTINNIQSPIEVWDCCAASGGKSILAKDILGDIELAVSDVRESILINLRKRFKEAGIKNFHSQLADLSKPSTKYSIFNTPRLTVGQEYSIIIADVPCTGSGTWSRTPEQLFYFDEKKIAEYAALQKKIVSNAIPHLKPGGYFLYITCSVFKKENEENAEFIKEKFHLDLIKIELLKGYDKKADSMFAALFRKSL